ncbi:MAG: DUF3576 domain-containing protein [Neomegalonema sp.]|nr:DUF3576 domain-containing protein [Neomegalonema sp.]
MATRISYRLGAVSAVAALTLLAGCETMGLSGVEVKESTAGRKAIGGRTLSPREEDQKRAGGKDDDGGLFGLGSKSKGVQLPVNKHLWRATLDTIAFLPLASTDPYGGVIITDWGTSPAAPEERVKVAAYITSAELAASSLRVVVNRQKKDGSGAWVEAPVSKDTARKLENAILTRARQLRSREKSK